MMFILLLQLSLFSFLDKPIDQWLDQSISGSDFIEILENKDTEIVNNISYEFYIKKSLIEFYKGKEYYNSLNKELSIQSFEKAIDLANKAVELEEKSEALGIISESGSYIMLQKGLSYIIQNSKKVNETALRALELDKNNKRAIIIVANGLLNAPKLFGGDKKKGLQMLLDIDYSNESKEIKYNTNIALGNAYKEMKDKNLAIKYYKECLKIYPNNNVVKDLLLALEG